MSSSPLIATILGIPSIPSIVEVNVRVAPGTNQNLIFKIPLKVKAPVVAVEPDIEGKNLDSKVYQWLKLNFPDGRIGWVRDDLVTIEGDGTRFGYGVISQPLLAFSLTRKPATSTPSAPSTPTTPPQAPPQAPPVTPPTPPATPPAADATAIARVQGGVNVRSAPSIKANPPLGRLQFGERLKILGVKPDQDFPNNLRWINVQYKGSNGWLREDVVRLDGTYQLFDLASPDAYPTPMRNCQWQRDFNTDPKYYDIVHQGWDFSARVGEPVLAGPKVGTVTRTFRCTRCTLSAPSAMDQGLGLGNPAVLSDPAWGYGYGNYVIIRYLNEHLPASTKAALAKRNLTGAHLYTMYAHLSSIDCAQGQTLVGGIQLGACGNTGNSSGSHLHLEVRASFSPEETQWSTMLKNLLTPAVLFLR
jgi:murein DD-endopeptidase MepM/ murein hydrolase activator NlpD